MNLAGDSETAQGSEKRRLAALPGARAALILLLSINLFNYIDRQVLAAVLPPIESEFFPQGEGRDPYAEAKLGSLQTAFMVSYMLIAPIFGWMADRTSRWWLIGVGVILWSLASGGSGWIPTHLAGLATPFVLLLVTRCFVGVGEAAYGPAAPTIISDLYPVAVRGKVLAWFYAAIPVGSALGFAVGGISLKITPEWRYAFYAVVPPGLLLGLVCFFMREPPRGQADMSHETPSRKGRLKDCVTFLKTPSYVLNTLGMTAMTFALGGMAFWMPRYILLEKSGISADAAPDVVASKLGGINFTFGIIVVVSGLVATLLGGIAGDRLRDRFPGSYFLVSGFSMIIGFPMVLLVLTMPEPWCWIFIFIACFCLFFNTGPTNTALANVTHPAIRSTAFALNILVIHALGDAISPAVIGYIASVWNMNAGLFVVSLAILVGGILWLWGAKYLAHDTELAPTRLRA
ncbi:MAG TPA: MFS transporter [Gemmataceae bacterium]|nr:MFS transporter [Gemmataceae bacterium]